MAKRESWGVALALGYNSDAQSSEYAYGKRCQADFLTYCVTVILAFFSIYIVGDAIWRCRPCVMLWISAKKDIEKICFVFVLQSNIWLAGWTQQKKNKKKRFGTFSVDVGRYIQHPYRQFSIAKVGPAWKKETYTKKCHFSWNDKSFFEFSVLLWRKNFDGHPDSRSRPRDKLHAHPTASCLKKKKKCQLWNYICLQSVTSDQHTEIGCFFLALATSIFGGGLMDIWLVCFYN